MPLSKTDFKLASTCGKKLVYKKASYPTLNDADDYMEMLANSGYAVGKLAQLLYSGGVEVKAESVDVAVAETRRLLDTNESVTLFEAAFSSGGRTVRVDILVKNKNLLRL